MDNPAQPNNSDSPDSGGLYLPAAVAAMLIWSTSFVVTKLAYQSFAPLTLGALRFVVASVILAVLNLRKGFILPPRKDLLILSISGILGITLYFALENVGVSLTSASNAALIMASYPAITVFMERMIYGVKVSTKKWVGIALAIIGVLFVSGVNLEDSGEHQLIGNLMLVSTGLVWALYNFTTRTVVNRYPAVTVSFYQTIAGTLAFIPLAFLEADSWQAPTEFSIAMLFYLGTLCSVAAFMLYNYGLRKLRPGIAVSLSNLVPVFGVLLSVLILKESVSVWQLGGGLVVLYGVYLSVKE